jgi:Tfp pilus assembly protein FimV
MSSDTVRAVLRVVVEHWPSTLFLPAVLVLIAALVGVTRVWDRRDARRTALHRGWSASWDRQRRVRAAPRAPRAAAAAPAVAAVVLPPAAAAVAAAPAPAAPVAPSAPAAPVPPPTAAAPVAAPAAGTVSPARPRSARAGAPRRWTRRTRCRCSWHAAVAES